VFLTFIFFRALVLTAHRDILDENVKGVISKKIDVLPAEGAGVIDIKEKEKIKHDARVEPVKRAAGEQWIVHGPTTYIPQPFVTIVREVCGDIISPNILLFDYFNCKTMFLEKRSFIQ
tara:strand:- start:874 stop:1227 length:354 start_codon:yes stop_codon:yes gene_type:complete